MVISTTVWAAKGLRRRWIGAWGVDGKGSCWACVGAVPPVSAARWRWAFLRASLMRLMPVG